MSAGAAGADGGETFGDEAFDEALIDFAALPADGGRGRGEGTQDGAQALMALEAGSSAAATPAAASGCLSDVRILPRRPDSGPVLSPTSLASATQGISGGGCARATAARGHPRLAGRVRPGAHVRACVACAERVHAHRRG